MHNYLIEKVKKHNHLSFNIIGFMLKCKRVISQTLIWQEIDVN